MTDHDLIRYLSRLLVGVTAGCVCEATTHSLLLHMPRIPLHSAVFIRWCSCEEQILLPHAAGWHLHKHLTVTFQPVISFNTENVCLLYRY